MYVALVHIEKNDTPETHHIHEEEPFLFLSNFDRFYYLLTNKINQITMIILISAKIHVYLLGIHKCIKSFNYQTFSK